VAFLGKGHGLPLGYAQNHMLNPDARQETRHRFIGGRQVLRDQHILTSASFGASSMDWPPGEPASKMQSEPSSRSNFPASFFGINTRFASPPLCTSPSLGSLSIRVLLMPDLRLRSQSSSPKPVTTKGVDSYSVTPTTAPRTHLLTRLLYVTSVILSMLCLAYVGGRERTPLPDAYALCSRSGAHIYTVDLDHPRVQCMVVQGSHIVDVGAIGM